MKTMTYVEKRKLINFCVQVLKSVNMTEENAEITAQSLVEADQMGIHSHGVKNLNKYYEKIKLGKLDPACNIEVINEGEGFAVLDAHNAMGMVSAYRGMHLAMEKARRTGIGYVCVRNSCHFGAGGIYSNLAAKHGMLGIAMSNTDPNMAVPGSIGMTIGNNPFSYAYPSENNESVFLDVALSATAALKINKARQEHTSIPNTWLVDDHGEPTTDPNWYGNGGALQPIAAHKGYGLSVMVEVLSAIMSGGKICRDVPSWCFDLDTYNCASHAFIAFDIAAICGSNQFAQRTSDYETYIKNARTKDSSVHLMMPGEIEWTHLHESEQRGVELPDDVMTELRNLEKATSLQLAV